MGERTTCHQWTGRLLRTDDADRNKYFHCHSSHSSCCYSHTRPAWYNKVRLLDWNPFIIRTIYDPTKQYFPPCLKKQEYKCRPNIHTQSIRTCQSILFLAMDFHLSARTERRWKTRNPDARTDPRPPMAFHRCHYQWNSKYHLLDESFCMANENRDQTQSRIPCRS